MFKQTFKPYITIRIALALLLTAGATLLLIRANKPTLPEQLTQELDERFPKGTTRRTIEAWLKTQPTRIEKTHPFHRAIGGKSIDEIAGVEISDVEYTLLATFDETRWVICDYEISVYMFFDKDDRLIKYWIGEFHNAL